MTQLAVDFGVELPASWMVVALQDVAGVSPKLDVSSLSEDDLVHFVPMAAVSEDFGGLDASQLRPVREVRKGYTGFVEGDVLFAKITPCMENGKGALVPMLPHGCAFGSTEFHVLRPGEAMSGKWLAYYLSQPDFRRVARQNMTGTAGQLRVPTKWLSAAGIPLPPRAEQDRVIEKLEELLTELDAGVTELMAAQRKLAQYRQSLLKAAVAGVLTADWRAAHGTPQETGADLLQRILTERRARWEQKQLAKFAAQRKTPPKGWQVKYPEPAAPDTAELPSLPASWTWASLDQLTEFVTSGSRGWADYYADTGATFIRSQNINRDFLDLSEVAYVSPPRTSEGTRTRVRKNDLLLTITGANVGRAAVVEVELEEAYVSQHVALIRPVDSSLSRYLHLYLICRAGGRGQLNKKAYGAGKPGLNLQQIQSIAVPVPSADELRRILEVLTLSLEAASAHMDSIERGLDMAIVQRKNLLKAAFAGQLVSQDPNDEPASALLARIRAARASDIGSAPRRRRKTA